MFTLVCGHEQRFRQEAYVLIGGSERRKEIVRLIQESEKPVPAKALAARYDVSRQVIVQDIALIRAAGYDIISTNRGYISGDPVCEVRVFKVQHTDEQMEEELRTIVDLGGCVDNVMVNHKVYGHMEAELDINSIRKVELFMKDIRSGKSRQLKNITSDYHYNKVSGDNEEVLDMIQDALQKKGFLVNQNSPENHGR